MKAPFPYFGGKSTVAPDIWARLGDTPNYVEPFFGSGAVLLARPDSHAWWDRIETVNDADGLLANFWRAVQGDPTGVAHWADWPVNENDLHARHIWLVERKVALQADLEGDPDYYDAKIAGWWLWGLCCWIGRGWCSGEGPWRVVEGELLKVAQEGVGIMRQRVHLSDQGITRKLVDLGSGGRGINRKLVHLGSGGRGHAQAWTEHLREMMLALQDRLRRVRVCCGDWTRVMGPVPTWVQGITAVFLDSPYSHAERDSNLYTVESDISHEVRAWALANGDNPLLRIALCGYEGEHDMPETWECFEWSTQGGYGLQGAGAGRENRFRERIWFSPHCPRPQRAVQLPLV